MSCTLPFKLAICLLASIHPATSWCLLAGTRSGRDGSTKSRTTLTTTASSSAANGDDGNPKSIADYTLGLHGGKYQFDDYSGVSVAGQEFAASLYSSEDGKTGQVDYAAEPWPAWAVRLSGWTATECSASSSVQLLPVDGIVKVVNEEMTWERYYAFVVPRDRGTAPFSVDPWVGVLSPRGGQAMLKVTPSSSSSSSVEIAETEPSWLVVGTETERWVYSLPH
eukprot:scaffold83_cov181-Amphora_coffeaeformis.AAC.30